MISETGENLSILIVTEPELDWQTFATWYSVFKNLPDAPVSIVCQRNGKTPFHFMQWTKRLRLNTRITDRFSDFEQANWMAAVGKLPVLLLRPMTLVVDVLDQKTLEGMGTRRLWINEDAWFLNNLDVSALLDSLYLDGELEMSPFQLCGEAKDITLPITTFRKGCGRWINTSQGCPFSSAAGLMTEDMSVNEAKAIDLWQRMNSLYNAVN